MAALNDMGGQEEFYGPVVREPNEPVFHDPWEGRVFGMALTMLPALGRNIDALRYAQEQLPRDLYLGRYYRRWLAGLESRLVHAGYLGPDEVDARLAGRTAAPGPRRMSPIRRLAISRMMTTIMRPKMPRLLAGYLLPRALTGKKSSPNPNRFSVGDRIRVRSTRADGHTRQPEYITGKPGVIVTHFGAMLFADARAVDQEAPPQHLYTVAFDGADLWGDKAEPNTEVRIDLFESYLEAP